jgi:hypothetical protein
MSKKVQVKPMSILFIGNSFTARNNLPEIIGRLAETRGKQLNYRLISAGGASLRMHWNKGEAQKRIQRAPYDYVVLQEQSTLPIKNPVRMHENIRLFDQAIRDSGAKTALYLTWARQDVPEMQKEITNAYTSIGKELDATIVPVGVAWQNVIKKQKGPALHAEDKSHPTLAGSYLAACVFLGTLFNESPVGISSELKGVTQAEVELLQKTAWATIKKG